MESARRHHPLTPPGLTRRQVVTSAASAPLLSALACRQTGQRSGTKTSAGAPGPAGKQPQRGGTLNYAGGEAGSYDSRGVPLDPNTSAQFSAKGFSLFYERLLGYDLQTYAVQPELAQKWEQPSPTEYV